MSRIDFTPGLPTRLQARRKHKRKKPSRAISQHPFWLQMLTLARGEYKSPAPCKSPATADRSARFVNNDLFLWHLSSPSARLDAHSNPKNIFDTKKCCSNHDSSSWHRFRQSEMVPLGLARPPFTERPRTTPFQLARRQSIQQIVPVNPLRMRALDIWPTIDGQCLFGPNLAEPLTAHDGPYHLRQTPSTASFKGHRVGLQQIRL